MSVSLSYEHTARFYSSSQTVNTNSSSMAWCDLRLRQSTRVGTYKKWSLENLSLSVALPPSVFMYGERALCSWRFVYHPAFARAASWSSPCVKLSQVLSCYDREMQSLMCWSSLVHVPDVTQESMFSWLSRSLTHGSSENAEPENVKTYFSITWDPISFTKTGQLLKRRIFLCNRFKHIQS